ncbi:hypothetical protein [Microvirga arabica]|uniref:Uncharacterized protein n=1 Tax=Microvirga arabica TaxID=1128671 RepID=A0ABV6YA07_9HYPH|nr:hypothetical protein [Microvirga arabica]MBM1174412.1 hypothetical protein [Microvirga arabica]
MSYKFKVRQPIRPKQPGFSGAQNNSASVNEVVRLVPADQIGEVSYRIKSAAFGVRGSEIAAQASRI